FDNLEGRFGNAVLDAALTGTSWKDRILGVNRMAEAPLYMTWYATGNNVIVAADTARRVCHVRLVLLAEIVARRGREIGAGIDPSRAATAARGEPSRPPFPPPPAPPPRPPVATGHRPPGRQAAPPPGPRSARSPSHRPTPALAGRQPPGTRRPRSRPRSC